MLTLYFSRNNSTLITRAMKLMFLYDEVFNIKEREELDYIPYDFGPFADNFQLNLTPLITEEIISYRELCKSEYISLDCVKDFFINEKNRKKLVKVLEQDYINQDKYYEDIKLIKFLSQIYVQSRTNDLIQLCYYLKPEFTKKSIIRDKINLLDRHFNQNAFINLVTILNRDHLLSLLDNKNGILDLFKIEQNHNERDNFSLLLNNISSSVMNSDEVEKEIFVHTIENIGVQDENKSYNMLKYKLLEFLSFDPSFIQSYNNKRQFLVYFLKSLQFNWPLNKYSAIKFRDLVKDYRKSTNLNYYKEYIDPLRLDEENLKIDLTIKLKPKSYKERIDISFDQIDYSIISPSDENILIESKISSFYEEYSQKDAQELEESITEQDDLESVEAAK